MKKEVYDTIALQANEKILDRKICKRCSEEFPIFELQKTSKDKLEISHKTTLCPSCSMRKLMSFRNERKLYKNTCSITGKPIISIYAPETGSKVCNNKSWYEEDFTTQEPLPKLSLENIDQELKKIYTEIPQMALINSFTENSEYANFIVHSKNVYLSYLTYTNSENILYSYYSVTSENITDCYRSDHSQIAYECIDILNCYDCFFCSNLKDCSQCYFSINLENCQNCIFCNNLTNKSYYIGNKAYSKEEYQTEKEKIKEEMKSYNKLQNLLEKYKQVSSKAIFKATNIINSENSAGNNIVDSKKSILSFDSLSGESCINVYGSYFKNNANIIGGMIENSYNSCMVSGNLDNFANKLIGAFDIVESSHIFYSREIFFSQNVLFSIGLQNKSYALLNRILPKDKWKEKYNLIKDLMDSENRWGEFLSSDLNSFPYNDTASVDYYPIKSIKTLVDNIENIDKKNLEQYIWNEEIINHEGKGTVYILEKEKFISKAILDLGGAEKVDITWRTKDLEITVPNNMETLDISELADNVDDVDNDILKKAIICQDSGRPFRIVGAELEFYRKHGLPLPRKHPEIRHLSRGQKRTNRELYLRKCDKCNKEVLSGFSPSRTETIFCEDCYTKENYR